MKKRIYFDNGSTSWPKAPKVGSAMTDFLTIGGYNINRGSYEEAYSIEALVLDTRDKLAELFHISDSRYVIFTPGITYSLNFFIKGLLTSGDHVLVTGIEHNAVMRPLSQMTDEGVTYDIIPTDSEGNIRLDEIEKIIRFNTKAIIVSHASNVCGTITPIKEIGEICKRRHLFFAVDTAQSAGTLDIDMSSCNIDFLAFTGHKALRGPQGIGGFLISEELNTQLKPLLAGGTGSQSDSLIMPESLPDKFECGTMNLPGIVGLHEALLYLMEHDLSQIRAKKLELTNFFLESVSQLPDIQIIGRQDMLHRVAVVSLNFLKLDNACAAFELEQKYGVMTRVGLHCAPIAHKSLGTFPEGTVRFSFSDSNTIEEIQECINGLKILLNAY